MEKNTRRKIGWSVAALCFAALIAPLLSAGWMVPKRRSSAARLVILRDRRRGRRRTERHGSDPPR